MKKSTSVEYEYACEDAFGYHKSTSPTDHVTDDAFDAEIESGNSRHPPRFFHSVSTTALMRGRVAWKLHRREFNDVFMT